MKSYTLDQAEDLLIGKKLKKDIVEDHILSLSDVE